MWCCRRRARTHGSVLGVGHPGKVDPCRKTLFAEEADPQSLAGGKGSSKGASWLLQAPCGSHWAGTLSRMTGWLLGLRPCSEQLGGGGRPAPAPRAA